MQIPPFKLERYFARYEFNVDYVLCSSDCESLAIQDLLALEPNAAERFHQHWLGYTESMGSPPLRREICSLYRDIQPDQVLLLPGTLYDDNGNHFRIGFGRRNLPEAIGRLKQFLQQL
jgi:hypothetical protein